jgi:predicted O-methyltransferase YrrM
VASATGHPAIATSLLAVLLAGALVGVVHLSRRIGGLHRANQASVRDLRLVVDQLQRRLVAAVEKERLAAGDRHQELSDGLARTERLAGRGGDLLHEQNREFEALLQLFQAVTPRAPMPTGGSPLNPSDLLGLLHIVRRRQPELVVALAAGALVVWLGYAVEKSGARLVAVHHDRETADRSRDLVLAHGLTCVEVIHAPMTDLSVDGTTVDWYDVDALEDVRDIDLLLVDGPPSVLPPALHVLGRRLTPGAAVVVDDPPAAGDRTAPRQGAGALTPERRLLGRYTALSYTSPMAPIRT